MTQSWLTHMAIPLADFVIPGLPAQAGAAGNPFSIAERY
jgi:hypothetical protein